MGREPWTIDLGALLRLDIHDRAGRRARLLDLRIDVGDEDHPCVTALIIGRGRRRIALPWTAVSCIHDRIDVATLAGAADAEPRGGEIRLVRDVLDSLVLDLQGRRGARVNDLLLADE